MDCAALSRDTKVSRPSERAASAAAEETERRGERCLQHRLSQEVELARPGGEAGQTDRYVYASVSPERRNLPELGQAMSGLLGLLPLYAKELEQRSPLSSALLLYSKGNG